VVQETPNQTKANNLDQYIASESLELLVAQLRGKTLIKEIQNERQQEEQYCSAYTVKNGNFTGPRKAVFHQLGKTNVSINRSIFFYVLLCINHG